jgi:hypothetical protein
MPCTGIHGQAPSEPSLRDRLLLWFGLIEVAPCRGYASIWTAIEPYDPHKDDYTQHGMKIIGPLPDEQAEGALTNLKRMLDAAGVTVEVEIVADD